MARLVDDLLDAARINSGKVTLTVQPVLLTDVINQAAEGIQAGLSDRGQTLKLSFPRTPIVLNGDTVRLTQIFSNLLHNACKFGGDGTEIALTATLVNGEAVVTVHDEGVGIAPELLPTIFELFTQGPCTLARSGGGLGIGLSIVRNLVALHGGTVGALSNGLNHGATFTVTLPVSPAGQVESPIAQVSAVTSKIRRVLLVDDRQDAREALSALLELEGHTVSVAGDGETAFTMAVSYAYDVLICDIGLPGMDGIELVQRLRKEQRQKMPFTIALSGYGDDLIRTRAADAGFDRYLVKPADSDALIRLLAEP
ncbi:Autoinducer 2 sensor kinase/phosphatase LuxQ (plasmid) [Caballeronia sp. SBC2]|nr:Autoinducer 2 sensor kinase/phosphatase LuxQ [Caballeronia sp. SBC2]